MYFNIWKSSDLSKFDDYYEKNFKENISVADEDKEPIGLTMNYDDLFKQAIWQKEAVLGCGILNKMTGLGMPESYRID